MGHVCRRSLSCQCLRPPALPSAKLSLTRLWEARKCELHHLLLNIENKWDVGLLLIGTWMQFILTSEEYIFVSVSHSPVRCEIVCPCPGTWHAEMERNAGKYSLRLSLQPLSDPLYLNFSVNYTNYLLRFQRKMSSLEISFNTKIERYDLTIETTCFQRTKSTKHIKSLKTCSHISVFFCSLDILASMAIIPF